MFEYHLSLTKNKKKQKPKNNSKQTKNPPQNPKHLTFVLSFGAE